MPQVAAFQVRPVIGVMAGSIIQSVIAPPLWSGESSVPTSTFCVNLYSFRDVDQCTFEEAIVVVGYVKPVIGLSITVIRTTMDCEPPPSLTVAVTV
jgi:hypothetical protein